MAEGCNCFVWLKVVVVLYGSRFLLFCMALVEQRGDNGRWYGPCA